MSSSSATGSNEQGKKKEEEKVNWWSLTDEQKGRLSEEETIEMQRESPQHVEEVGESQPATEEEGDEPGSIRNTPKSRKLKILEVVLCHKKK